MLLGFGSLYKFVMFFFLNYYFKKPKVIEQQKPVGQNFVI